jgi:hypothetical protein
MLIAMPPPPPGAMMLRPDAAAHSSAHARKATARMRKMPLFADYYFSIYAPCHFADAHMPIFFFAAIFDVISIFATPLLLA